MTVDRKTATGQPSETPDVKQRILEAALHVFAMKGFDAASVRDITDAAEANVAAVNYYYGSKVDLLRAVVATTLGPLNQSRAERLDELLAREQSPSVPELLYALLEPLVKSRRSADDGRIVVRLLQQMRVGSVGLSSKLLSEQFDSVAQRYIAALVTAAPHFTRQEVIWRYEFVRGAAMQVLGDIDPQSGRLSLLAESEAGSDDDAVLGELVRFAVGGFEVSSLTPSGRIISEKEV
jgi:AcrR family transcriptional regulator